MASDSFTIKDIIPRQVLDSRGNPTLEVEVLLSNGAKGSFSVPSGASKGKHEAVELRDGGRALKGKGVLRAIRSVLEYIRPALLGMNALNQKEVDYTLIELDGTENKSFLGANAVLGVSVAVAKATANGLNIPLYKYIGGVNSNVMPVPFMNVINGGAHAGNDLSIQEFMIVPKEFETFRDALFAGVEVYMELRDLLKEKYGRNAVNVGDEGGFAPPMSKSEEALEALIKSIDQAGYSDEIYLAIDCAASGFYSDGSYLIDGRSLSPGELMDYYSSLIDKYPIISVEDPFHEEDWESLAEFTRKFGGRVQVVGDDYFVTNVKRLKIGIAKGAANALLLKVNQVGTLTEALEAAQLAFRSKYRVMVSHRSGETTDDFISDLAVALNSGQIKTGAPARGERVAKYNRLLRIEEELGSQAHFAR